MGQRNKRSGLGIPASDPVPNEVTRPFWSVMMPTYNCSDHFEQALRAVLDQDPGADRMQIAAIDDCSTNGRSEEIVNRLAPGRIELHREPNDVGLGRNWNTCVQRSRGHWIHILHQNDLVLPGYYETMERSVRDRPDIGAAFCRHASINGRGERTSVSELEIDGAGVLEDWL